MTLPLGGAVSLAYTRVRRVPAGLWEIRARATALPDGTTRDEDDTSEPLVFSTHESVRGILDFSIAEFATPLAPPLWFVSVDESRATPRATNLVAFADDSLPPGTIISRYQFASLGVHNSLQAGAVRWYPDGGLVHQIFVAEQWRRHHVGTHLLYAAEAFHQSNGWAGKLNGDGRRTQLGEQLIAGLASYPERFLPLVQTMPPMDHR